jgi:hypothetical protein
MRYSTKVFFGGTGLYLEPHFNLCNLIIKNNDILNIESINSISFGNVFGILLVDNMIFSKEYNSVKSDFTTNLKYHHDNLLPLVKKTQFKKTQFKKTQFKKQVLQIIDYVYRNTSKDIHLKCSNILNIYYTRTNSNVILEQVICKKWESKKDLFIDLYIDLYKSLSIPYINIAQCCLDDVGFLGHIEPPTENEIVLVSFKNSLFRDVIKFAYHTVNNQIDYDLNFKVKGGNIYYNGTNKTNRTYDLLTGFKLPFNFIKYLKYILLYIYYKIKKLSCSFKSYIKVLNDIIFMYYPRLKN